MEEIGRKLGEIAIGAIIDAIRRGKSRDEALDEAAAAVRRSEIVNDDLWNDLQAYIEDTKSFEENGAS